VKPVEVSVWIAASPEMVWSELECIEDHALWMSDATGIGFVGDQRRGVGTRLRVATRVGPFRMTDDIEFTEWEPPTTMVVRHLGPVSGTGRFEIMPSAEGATLTRIEMLELPWFLGGPLGRAVVLPTLTRIWSRDLRRLRDRISSR